MTKRTTSFAIANKSSGDRRSFAIANKSSGDRRSFAIANKSSGGRRSSQTATLQDVLTVGRWLVGDRAKQSTHIDAVQVFLATLASSRASVDTDDLHFDTRLPHTKISRILLSVEQRLALVMSDEWESEEYGYLSRKVEWRLELGVRQHRGGAQIFHRDSDAPVAPTWIEHFDVLSRLGVLALDRVWKGLPVALGGPRCWLRGLDDPSWPSFSEKFSLAEPRIYWPFLPSRWRFS